MSTRAKQRERARDERLAAERAEAERLARERKVRFGAIAVFAAIIVGALIVISQSGGGGGSGDPADDASEVESQLGTIPREGIALGDPDAPLTMVEFGDLQCPFCRQFDVEVLPSLIEDYVRPGKLRIEFRPLTFIGPDSEEAARMAGALIGKDRYWDFVDLFYRRQGTENSGYVTDEYLTELAGALPGVDAESALAERNTPAIDALLAESKRLAQQNGVQSTPSFLIGEPGGKLEPLQVGRLEPEAFKPAIDQALARSQ